MDYKWEWCTLVSEWMRILESEFTFHFEAFGCLIQARDRQIVRGREREREYCLETVQYEGMRGRR